MRVLVMAKAPVPGLAKTRLAAVVGDTAAAEVAAAGLLDTLQASRATGAECLIAMTGDMGQACRRGEIEQALEGWTVLQQRAEAFDERLANAHLDCGDGALIQIGMDTPQVTPDMLLQAGQALEHHDTVLGPADDGGWWVFGRHEAVVATALLGVPMSTSQTCEHTRRALASRGLGVEMLESLRDVDLVADAEAVARAAPHTRFAHTWDIVAARS